MNKLKHFSVVFGLGSLLLANAITHAGTVMSGVVKPPTPPCTSSDILLLQQYLSQLNQNPSTNNYTNENNPVIIPNWHQLVSACGNTQIKFVIAGQQGYNNGGSGGITILDTTLGQLAKVTGTSNLSQVGFVEYINYGGGQGGSGSYDMGGGYSALWIVNPSANYQSYLFKYPPSTNYPAVLLGVGGGGGGTSYGGDAGGGGGGGIDPGENGANGHTGDCGPQGGGNGSGGLGYGSGTWWCTSTFGYCGPVAYSDSWSEGGFGGNGGGTCGHWGAGGGGGYGGGGGGGDHWANYGGGGAGGGGYCNTNVGTCSASDYTNGGGNTGSGYIKVSVIPPNG